MEDYYMNLAIKEAKKAFKLGEMPVGAVIVYKNKVIATGYNKKEKKKNSLMHAEIIAINKACKKLKDWRLNNCIMYVTMEPCNMCMGAIIESRIEKLICGVRNYKSKNINELILKKEKIKVVYEIRKNDIEKIINMFFLKIRNR